MTEPWQEKFQELPHYDISQGLVYVHALSTDMYVSLPGSPLQVTTAGRRPGNEAMYEPLELLCQR